ncbi:MAG: hypothetical protein AAFR38_09200 [Planctomycetota bacterium]
MIRRWELRGNRYAAKSILLIEQDCVDLGETPEANKPLKIATDRFIQNVECSSIDWHTTQ